MGLIICKACRDLPKEGEAEEPQSYRTCMFNKSHLTDGWNVGFRILTSGTKKGKQNTTHEASTHGLHGSKMISAQLLKDANVEQNKEKV